MDFPEERQLEDLLINGVPSPKDGEKIGEYLERVDVLGKGFGLREIVKRNPLSLRFGTPPRRMWPDLALAVAVASAFRQQAIATAGVRGIRVAAAYRPFGGAKRSAHKKARALDLDRIGGDAGEYFKCAVRFWCKWGRRLRGGLGLYTWGRTSKGGIRVHMDVRHGCRSWQGIRRGFGRPYNIKGRSYGLPVFLAYRMGLDVPSLKDL